MGRVDGVQTLAVTQGQLKAPIASAPLEPLKC